MTELKEYNNQYIITKAPSINELEEARKWPKENYDSDHLYKRDSIEFETIQWEIFKWKVSQIIQSTNYCWSTEKYTNRTFVTINEDNTNRNFQLYISRDKYDEPTQIVKEELEWWNFEIITNTKWENIENKEFGWNNWKIDLRHELMQYCWWVSANVNWLIFPKLKIEDIINTVNSWDDPIINLWVFWNWIYEKPINLTELLDLDMNVYVSSNKIHLRKTTINHWWIEKEYYEQYYKSLEEFRKYFFKK